MCGEFAVGIGRIHRRDEVVDDDGVAAAFGLGPFAGVVEDERVDERKVVQEAIGETVGGEAQPFAGEPFERAVLADVDDGVGTPGVAQPAVEAVIVVRGG